MTALRQTMLEDMRVRNLAPHTQKAYIGCVAAFARHFGKSPDQLGPDEIRAYLLHLRDDRHLSTSTITQAYCALRFLYARGQDGGSTPGPVLPRRLYRARPDCRRRASEQESGLRRPV